MEEEEGTVSVTVRRWSDRAAVEEKESPVVSCGRPATRRPSTGERTKLPDFVARTGLIWSRRRRIQI